MWLVCSGCDPAPAPAPDPAAIARGRAAFLEHCALCHGERADGRGLRQSSLSSPPVDFTSRGWRRGAVGSAVEQVVREGRPGTSMAAWAALGDATISDLTVYVLSVSESGP